MPFKSQSQRRFMYAAEARGDVPKGTAKKWEEHTPKDKKLPEKVEKTAFEQGFEKEAFWGAIVGAAARAGRGVAQAGRGLVAKSTNIATNPAMSGFRQGLGRIGAGVGRGIQRAGLWMGRNPQATAGIAAGAAGAGAIGLGAHMLGSDKSASAFEQGFRKQATIGQTFGKAVHVIGEHPNVLHGAELAGLGVLAAPGIANLARGEYKPGTHEKAKDVAETAGLGILAVPSAAHFASKFLRH